MSPKINPMGNHPDGTTARFWVAKTNPASVFWSKVDIRGADECWPWEGGRRPIPKERRGRVSKDEWYGDFRGKPASRACLEILSGTDVPRDMFVLHSCDHPWCVNPRHLRIGTHADNMRDMSSRGRASSGIDNSQHGMKSIFAKLSETDVLDIRRRVYLGQSIQSIASEFHVSAAAVYLIHRRKTWKWLA